MSAPTLQALVERYLVERRRLGFDLRKSAYALRSFARYVRRRRPPRAADRGDHGRLGATRQPRQHRSSHLGAAAQAVALVHAMAAAVRAAHRGSRRCDLRASARAPGAAHLQRAGVRRSAGRRAPARTRAWPARHGLRDAVRSDRLLRAAAVRGAGAAQHGRRSQARDADHPPDQVRQVAPGAHASEQRRGLASLSIDARPVGRVSAGRGGVLRRHARATTGHAAEYASGGTRLRRAARATGLAQPRRSPRPAHPRPEAHVRRASGDALACPGRGHRSGDAVAVDLRRAREW